MILKLCLLFLIFGSLTACEDKQVTTGAQSLLQAGGSGGSTLTERELDHLMFRHDRAQSLLRLRELSWMKSRYGLRGNAAKKVSSGFRRLAYGDMSVLPELGLSRASLAYASLNGTLARQDVRSMATVLKISESEVARVTNALIQDLERIQ